MSALSNTSRFSASTRSRPHSAPFSRLKEPILSTAPSNGSSKAGKALVLTPSSSGFLVAADGDGNAVAGACSKKQEMGVEYWPELRSSGHVALSSSICSKGGGTSSSVSASEGLATSRQAPNLSRIPRIVDQGRESFRENIINKNNSNRDVEVMQQRQQIGGSNHLRVSYGGERIAQTGGATGPGSHHRSYVNRGPRGRGGPQWNAPYGFIRNPHMRMPSPPLLAPLQPFIPAPQPGAMPFYVIPLHDAGYPYYFAPPPPLGTPVRVPFIPPVPNQVPRLVSPATSRVPLDPQSIKLKKQIEFYFSVQNLCTDLYLRKDMDDQGWVPISFIATFDLVKKVTESVPFILNALQGSTVVEIQGEKIRKRDDWKPWLLPSTPEAKQIIQSLCNLKST